MPRMSDEEARQMQELLLNAKKAEQNFATADPKDPAFALMAEEYVISQWRVPEFAARFYAPAAAIMGGE